MSESEGRTLAREVVAAKFPDFVPRHDADLVLLMQCQQGFDGPNMTEPYLSIDQMVVVGSPDPNEHLSSEVVIGKKPSPGDNNVITSVIPGTAYSIRIAPGPVSQHLYTMDFISTESRQPINSPFQFTMWNVAPRMLMPWLTDTLYQIFSFEHNNGISREEIRPGEERFLLRDGQRCVIKREGQRDACFNVPVRESPDPLNSYTLF